MQPDYRGLAGYGEQWFRDGGFQSWRTALGDVSDAGRWIVSEGADPAKLSIVGWGYGGYAALQSGVVRSEEHTSELQSLMRISYAVFCLKNTNNIHHILHQIKIYNSP